MNTLNIVKKYFVIFLLIFSFVALTACSSNQALEYTKDQEAGYPEDGLPNQDSKSESADESGSYVLEPATERADQDVSIGSKENPAANRKLIKRGNADIKSNDVKASYQNIGVLVNKYEGFETNIIQNESDSYIFITVEYNIPAAKLDDFVAELSEAEDVKYLDIEAEDITNSYYDSEIRLDNLERSLEQYNKLLADATDMEDIIALQNEIDNITLNIESLKGQLKLWDSQIDYSTINIEISEYKDVVHINKDVKFSALDWETFKYYIGTGLIRVLSGIASVFQYLVIGLVISLPVLLPLALIIFLIVRLVRKKNKKYKQALEKQAKLVDPIDHSPVDHSPVQNQPVQNQTENPYQKKK